VTYFNNYLVYNINKSVKKRIDILLFKSLEFKNVYGQKVKIIEIPILEDGNTYRFMIQLRLETFITKVYYAQNVKAVYSFRDYLKKVLKWPVYEQIFKSDILKNNA
jgi:hypothetical protein